MASALNATAGGGDVPVSMDVVRALNNMWILLCAFLVFFMQVYIYSMIQHDTGQHIRYAHAMHTHTLLRLPKLNSMDGAVS